MPVRAALKHGGSGAAAGLVLGLSNVLYQIAATGDGFAGSSLVDLLLDIATASRLALVGGLVVAFASAIFVFSIRLRRGATIVLTNCLAFCVSTLFMVSVADHVRIAAFADLSARSAPLIEAVTAFETRFGHPPPDLESLVPSFVKTLPATGMSAYPTYEYVTGEAALEQFADRWALYIDAPNGRVASDLLYYIPNERYPEYISRGLVEPVGRWAYVYK